MTPSIKVILLFFVTLSFCGTIQAQTMPQDSLEARWEAIDSLEKNGQYRSALRLTEQLIEQLSPDAQPIVYYRALSTAAAFRAELEEEGQLVAIRYLDSVNQQAAGRVRALLCADLAERYFRYFRSNSYRINNRTPSAAEEPDDPVNWSAEQFIATADSLYLTALEDPDLLLMSTEEASELIEPGRYTEGLRPTLYDLLAHRAIRYFTERRNYTPSPIESFRIDDSIVFAEAASFVDHEFTTPDLQAADYRALGVLQELLRFRLQAEESLPLTLADIDRLRFAFRQYEGSDGRELLVQALDRIADSQLDSAAAWALLTKMEYLIEWGQEVGYNDVQSAYRDAFRQAIAINNRIQGIARESVPARQAAALAEWIRRPQLNLQTETVYLPDAPGLAAIDFANISTLYTRIISAESIEEEQYDEELIKQLLRTPTVQEGRYPLPTTDDYRLHKTEISFAGLPVGKYLLLVSNDADFSSEQAIIAYASFTVSQLGLIVNDQLDEGIEAIVVNRSTGQPLDKVEVSMWANDGRGTLRKIGQTRTAADGRAQLQSSRDRWVYLRLKYGEDELRSDRVFQSNNYRPVPYRPNRQVQFFLDRGIFRPGQRLFFKGIALERSDDQLPMIQPNVPITVSLRDANNQQVATQELTTNAYGSIHGYFDLPKGRLPGQYHLETANAAGSVYFRVEEYKRPRFEVLLDTLSGTPSLGAAVEVGGSASTYAGPALQNAAYRYTVVRRIAYPYWFGYRADLPPERILARGQGTTDQEGAFRFSFVADTTGSSSDQGLPLYVFEVQVDVTDLTGETQVATKRIRLSRAPYLQKLLVPATSDRSNPLPVELQLTNLEGSPLPLAGTLALERLKAPARFFVNRYWERPDLYQMGRSDYRRLHPHYAYGEEDRPEQWPVEQTIWQRELGAGTAANLEIAPNTLETGHYRLVWTIETESGETITSQRFIEAIDAAAGKAPANQLLTTLAPQEPLQPGDQLVIPVVASEEALPMLVQRFRRGATSDLEWVNFPETAQLTDSISSEDRGGILYYLTYVRHNRLFSEQIRIEVPWSNKQLQVRYETFRDRLRPGTPETWRLKISGPAGEAIAAELAAVLYDASLDQFVNYTWNFDPWPTFFGGNRPQGDGFDLRYGSLYTNFRLQKERLFIEFPKLRYPNQLYALGRQKLYRGMTQMQVMDSMAPAAGVVAEEAAARSESPEAPPPPAGEPERDEGAPAPQIRTNLAETAFFFPNLMTDSAGNVVLEFDTPEALTRWNFRILGHTTDLQTVVDQREVVTQKELMVLPNPPRFLRERDVLEFTARVSNLTDQPLAGTAKLELRNPVTDQVVNGAFGLPPEDLPFQLEPQGSAPLTWKLTVPGGSAGLVAYTVSVSSGAFTDGEAATLPILSNQVEVTETLPIYIEGKSKKTVSLKALAEGFSAGQVPQRVTLETTANPSWLVVKSLPYLMEYPYPCTEQLLNRLVANAIGGRIIDTYPAIKEVFEQWQQDPQALESPLALNEELASALLVQTPWVLDAQSEAAQRRRIAQLFDPQRLQQERQTALQQLMDRQRNDGAFSWFPGGPASRYISQYVAESLHRLESYGMQLGFETPAYLRMQRQLIEYLDRAVIQEYEKLQRAIETKAIKEDAQHLSSLMIHYLYIRSQYEPLPTAQQDLAEAFRFYLNQGKQYWTNQGLYEQGLLALAFHASGEQAVAQIILTSLRERALHHETLGMHWKYNEGWTWNQLPLETHTLLFEVFQQLGGTEAELNELRRWLLTNKETNRWETTKATAAAIYAFLSGEGGAWIAEEPRLKIDLPEAPKEAFDDRLAAAQAGAEAGTGSLTVSWQGDEIIPELGTVELQNKGTQLAWGGLYYRYLEDIDNVTASEQNALQLQRTIYRVQSTDRGERLEVLTGQSPLRPGDRLRIRLEGRADRDMEFVHLNDLRASGLEPTETLSGYQYQSGLGYYRTNTDLATNFFFDYLPKGAFVLEYDLFVVHEGAFSSGFATLQSMYAPKFSARTAGQRLNVGAN